MGLRHRPSHEDSESQTSLGTPLGTPRGHVAPHVATWSRLTICVHLPTQHWIGSAMGSELTFPASGGSSSFHSAVQPPRAAGRYGRWSCSLSMVSHAPTQSRHRSGVAHLAVAAAGGLGELSGVGGAPPTLCRTVLTSYSIQNCLARKSAKTLSGASVVPSI